MGKLEQKKITVIIIISVLLSLIGILVIQASWLNRAILTNNKIFQQKVDLASKNISETYRKQPKLPQKVHQSISENSKDIAFIHQEIKAIIDRTFNEANLPLSYTYGLYKHKNRVSNEMVYGNALDTILKNSTCNKKADRFFGWANLTCNKNYGNGNDYHLAIFPSYGSYIFNEVKWTLITSVVLIIIVLMGFIYTLRIIQKQTKLSTLKNDFINNLTHEFKTPLFSISLASKSLRKSDISNTSKDAASYLDVIDNESNHLKNQVEKILQLSMLDSGRLHLDKQKIDLNAFLKTVSSNFNLQLTEKNGKIDFDFDYSNPLIFGDKQYLRNVWYNLIDNALKYANKAPEVLISTKQIEENLIEISFKDNGIGIKKENHKIIFNRFYRETKGDIYNTKGFGVGLSYVTEILKLHNANIVLVESSSSGSTFKILFPRYEA